MKRREVEKWALAIIGIALLHLAIFCIREGGDMAVQIKVTPSAEKVRVGQTFTYEVEITPDVAVAGGQLDFLFNKEGMQVNAVTQGGFFGTTQSWFLAGTIYNSLGTVRGIAACSLGAGTEIATKGVFVRFTCTALKAGGTSDVSLANVVVANKAAQELPFELAISQVVFLPSYDLDGDGDVDKADMAIASLQFGKAGSADFNEDGVVTILDLVILGQNFT